MKCCQVMEGVMHVLAAKRLVKLTGPQSRTGHERCSVFRERCSALGVLFGVVSCFVRWLFCSAWCVRLSLDVLFGVLFGHRLWILICMEFCSGLLFCSGTVSCSAFCLHRRMFCSIGYFGLNDVCVRPTMFGSRPAQK